MPNFWRTGAPRILKIQWFPLIFGHKSCFLGPTIFKIPQPNWYYSQYSGRPTLAKFSQPFHSINTLLKTHSSLDAIPEDQVTDPPSVFQPLVPPPVPVSKVATTSYNISFPTTLQPRDRFDQWRGYTNTVSNSSARFSSGTGSSCSSVCSVPESPGSLASPFHEAKASNPYDVSEYQPLNVIESKNFS